MRREGGGEVTTPGKAKEQMIGGLLPPEDHGQLSSASSGG